MSDSDENTRNDPVRIFLSTLASARRIGFKPEIGAHKNGTVSRTMRTVSFAEMLFYVLFTCFGWHLHPAKYILLWDLFGWVFSLQPIFRHSHTWFANMLIWHPPTTNIANTIMFAYRVWVPSRTSVACFCSDFVRISGSSPCCMSIFLFSVEKYQYATNETSILYYDYIYLLLGKHSKRNRAFLFIFLHTCRKCRTFCPSCI